MSNGQPLLVGSVLRMGNYTRDDDTTYDYSVVLFILESFSLQADAMKCTALQKLQYMYKQICQFELVQRFVCEW